MGNLLNCILKRVGIKKSMPTEYTTIQIGKLTDEEMRRFNLGHYSKKSVPGSVSL